MFWLKRIALSFALACSVIPQTRAIDIPAAYSEPNVELAKLWWPDQRNVWTPIGWKDHYFRFNVLYNGSVIFEPYSDGSTRTHARKYKGQSFQATFTPWPDTNTPALPQTHSQMWKIDSGHGVQGWDTNHATPVLWTDFPLQEGLVIREQVFAHLQGGGDVQTGLEPQYAWIRLTVTHVDPLRAPKEFPMIVQLSRNDHVLAGHYMYEDGVTVDVDAKRAPYPKILTSVEFAANGKTGLRILEPDGKVRFVALPTETNKVSFYERSTGIYGLKVDLLAKEGDQVDLLMPMFPETPTDESEEEQLGFDAALAQSDAYWSRSLDQPATFHVPENYINEAINQSVKFAPMICEKDYETGAYSFLSGSWGYDELWPTPSSMNSHMFLSLLGYHNTVAKYADIFRKYQGTIKPPGAAYTLHPGYFGSPNYLTSIDWLADHGAVLLQVSTEALLSGDPKFIAEWTEPIVKACDFIKDNCEKTNHDGVVGLLPPAVATDAGIPTQAIWSLAWNYRGLTKAVELLKQIHHPRAAEFDALAKHYKETFVKAYREAATHAPMWKDDVDGKDYPLPPTTLSSIPMPFNSATDAFFLDTGPMVLVWAGLFDANDPLMVASVKFYREGPDWKLHGPRFNALCRPVLEHEISTCEPCYSWNVVHSWQLGDREKFLTGMYSVFVGALSQQTYISCEHRTGMQGNLFALPLAFWMARQAVIDDEIKPNELHLLRLCPLAWVSSHEDTVFERMPTVYGPVSLRCRLSPDGKTLRVSFIGDWRTKPGKVVLHIPPVPGLTAVQLNGKNHRAGEELVVEKF